MSAMPHTLSSLSHFGSAVASPIRGGEAMPPIYQSQVLDHLGLVAEIFDALGVGAVLDQAIPQDMTKRTVAPGQGLKAMMLNGLGFVHQQLYLVPRFFHVCRIGEEERGDFFHLPRRKYRP
jgi:hypothetical protein